jgi:SAM-dependent methyltransferase
MTTAGFYTRPSLHVDAYDVLHSEVPGGDDATFFRGLAERTGGPILELGCGTGRLAIPLAEAGFDVVGLDRSGAMLEVARAKVGRLEPAVRRRIRFINGDMSDLHLHRRFGLVFAAFRVFMALLDSDAQRATLAGVRRHLRPGGVVAIDLFDPRFDLLGPGDQPGRAAQSAILPSGNRVTATALTRHNDPLRQVLTERWRFTETGSDGEAIRSEDEELSLRWTHRHEMRHLLELEGFDIVAEYSDFAGLAPEYGGEQIWVARRPVGRTTGRTAIR